MVERLQCWHEVAYMCPPEHDEYFLEHPGLIPYKLAELLTELERRFLIDQLEPHKRQAEMRLYGKTINIYQHVINIELT